jgi:hypothetical protein
MLNWKLPLRLKILLPLGAGIMAFVAVSSVFSAAPVENKGAAVIRLAGGERGTVDFPHRRHQQKLNDCDICHSLFPQKAGIIEELKAQGKFKKKQVMNKLCVKCHRQKKREGIKAGPTMCARCHHKETR